MRNPMYNLLLFGLVLISCNQSEKTVSDAKKKTTAIDSTKTLQTPPPAPSTEAFTYNPSLDLYNDDKEVITQIGDTLGMKLVLIKMETGEEMPLHAHPPYHTSYFFEGSAMEISQDGVFWIEDHTPYPHGEIGGPTQTKPHGGNLFTLGEIPLQCVNLDVYDRSEMQSTAPFVYNAANDYYNLDSPSVIKIGDTLGLKMFVLNLNPGDSIQSGLAHPKQGVYVIEGGTLAIFKDGQFLTELKVKTNTGAIRNAWKGNDEVFFMKNIDTHPIKIWYTDVYASVD